MAARDMPNASVSSDQPVNRIQPTRIYRHRLPTRLWHGVNAVTLLVLLMSGLMIFNAHPRLYWGQAGANHDPAWLEIGATRDAGFLRVGSLRVETTGVLGRWPDRPGVPQTWAFPGWATLPTPYSLAYGGGLPLHFSDPDIPWSGYKGVGPG